MPSEQDRQAYLGRRLTRNWTGIMSRCHGTSSPMQCRRRLGPCVHSPFDARQVFWQRPAIGGARFGGAFSGPILGILFVMDWCNGGFQIFQRKFELPRIALLRPTPEGRLPELGWIH